MDRNFAMRNGASDRPARDWRTRIGPEESSLISRETTGHRGAEATSRRAEPRRSQHRFASEFPHTVADTRARSR
jgi:hypothetical protein